MINPSIKRIKDPLYDYVVMPTDLVRDVVNSAAFQRLRCITQTSYAPVYPSATHNRFVHSLGVYHLGRLASKTIGKTIDIRDQKKRDALAQYLETFEFACLLHDVGHAPFSHTGESFYLNRGNDRSALHEELIRLTGDNKLRNEITTQGYGAAPHELMSVIVALKEFSAHKCLATAARKSFFARAITGYQYVPKDSFDENEEQLNFSLLNQLIKVLNSTIIDVDKLDYLIRDAYLLGYSSVEIDYQRLLRSVRIERKVTQDDMDAYQLVYMKDAVSVLENVIYAHDAEKKWIQNHPTALYEIYLIEKSLSEVVLGSKWAAREMFSCKALGSDGVEVASGMKVRRLSDVDAMFMMKNIDSPESQMYFNRSLRHLPIWKSEAEYNALFRGFQWGDDILQQVERDFKRLYEYLDTLTSNVITEETYKKCEVDIEEEKDKLDRLTSDSPDARRQEKCIASKERHLALMNVLWKTANESGIPMDFVICRRDRFISNFSKDDLANTFIYFPNEVSFVKFADIVPTLRPTLLKHGDFSRQQQGNQQKSKEKDSIFFLYCHRTSEQASSVIAAFKKHLKAYVAQYILR